MSREARITTTFWGEDPIRKLTRDEQRAYLLARSQPDLNRCGVVAYRLTRWAKLAVDDSPAKLAKAFTSLAEARLVVIDQEMGELFVRTWMRHDGLLKSPNMVVGLSRDYDEIASDLIRNAVLTELRRIYSIPKMTAERAGIDALRGQARDPKLQDRISPTIADDLTKAIAEGVVEEFAEPVAEGFPDGSVYASGGAPSPSPSPSPSPTPTPSPAPTPSPSPQGSGDPSPGPAGMPAADDIEDDQAWRIVATAVNGQATAAEKRKLAGHVRQALADGATQEHAISALREWTTRDKPQPGLLPSLLGDAMRGGRRATATAAAVCRFCMRQLAVPSGKIRSSVVANSPESEVELARSAQWWAGADPVCDTAPDRIHVPGEPEAGGA